MERGPKQAKIKQVVKKTATGKVKKRDACDVDPNTDNSETETASVEHKRSDSTVLYIFCIWSFSSFASLHSIP